MGKRRFRPKLWHPWKLRMLKGYLIILIETKLLVLTLPQAAY